MLTTLLTISGHVALIPLTRRKYALIDVADSPLAHIHLWHARPSRRPGESVTRTFYAVRSQRIGRKIGKVLLHRLLMGNPPSMIDHKNGNGLDCRRENLRLATPTQNVVNARGSRGRSKYRGIGWHKQTGKWQAQIRINGKQRCLGFFEAEEDAARAYDAAALKAHGDFASLNFPTIVEGQR